MKNTLALLMFALAANGFQAVHADYPYRWVYVSRGLHKDRDVEDIRDIVRTASEHGLNGMVLSARLDWLDRQPPHYFERLEEVKRICAKEGVEIIPAVFSAGYGGSVLSADRNLAAGLFVKGAKFTVRGKEARLQGDSKATIENGGFEKYEGNRFADCWHDRPGAASFVDNETFAGGRASLRFEDVGRFEHGHGRVVFDVPVEPHRCYRVTCRLKSDNPRLLERFKILAKAGDTFIPPTPVISEPHDGWRTVTAGFNSLGAEEVRLYAGLWGGKQGKLWLDDFRIEEIALVNLLRRPGAPLTVRGEKSGVSCVEGRDFEPLADPHLNFRFDHAPPAIKLTADSRIEDGEVLRVSYYHGMAIGKKGQVTVCMSEPKLYELWQMKTRLIEEHLSPRCWLLSMDEVRAGGSCAACKSRGMSMAEILGDCITRQFDMIRRLNPRAEVFIWSDMLDPNHNARPNYVLTEGDYTGSWKYVPKQLRIVCWYCRKRKESLAHFSKLGFQTMAGAYYDGDSLDNPKKWLKAMQRTPGTVGIMYTTWQNKYDLLAPFGDLVEKHSSPEN